MSELHTWLMNSEFCQKCGASYRGVDDGRPGTMHCPGPKPATAEPRAWQGNPVVDSAEQWRLLYERLEADVKAIELRDAGSTAIEYDRAAWDRDFPSSFRLGMRS